ncbi:unnamed protein product [Prorocentrum cordatum]|uniref:Reverse transcriptase Ty1/copia-type domain-containing protein n=1 Tax=Prorocentrum cordatum TaxID=2364126 RepID=A0ABN9UYA5_9DINO|nr:unnamed protein product [Polarella glacialis]
MTAAGQRQDPLLNDQLDERARQVSQRLWHLLITYCEGKAMGVVKLSRKSGLEAWRQLKNEYESRSGNRWTAMLRFILNPQDKWAKDREAGADFFQSLTAWEAIVAEYVDQSGEAVSDNVRVSVLLEHAPDPYREVLRQAPEEVKLTFAAARSHIRGYNNQGRTFALVPDVGGVVPMQVDAVRAQMPNGKANGKGKTYKSDKSGGKSGRYQKGKDSKTKSKARDGGKHAKNQTEYFDGERGYCGKWGHKRADCRKKKADDSKKEPGHTRAVQGDASSSSVQQPADGTVKAALGYFDGKLDGWVFAVTAQPTGQVAKVGGSILIDSGSDDHLCRHRFVPEAPISAAVGAPRLFDVQQRPLPTAGLKGVQMAIKEGITATADFLVADVNDDLLSMGQLLRQGFRFNLSLEDGLHMTKGHRSVQLTLERSSPRLRLTTAAARQRGRRSEAERARKQAVKKQLGIQHDPVDARELPVPKAPGAEEKRQRRLTHLPTAARCEECVRGKAPDAPRAQIPLEDSGRKAPLISFDFGFCKTADEDGELTKVEDTYATMLAAFSWDAGVVEVIPCPSTSAPLCAIAGAKQFAQRLETGKCRLRTHSEPATKAILDGVVAELTGKVISELAPKHSSQSNPAEAAAKIAEGQTRVLRLDLEKRYGTRITSKRARVAAVHELGVGNIDDPPDAFWEEISDEAEDQTEDMLDVDAQDELDKKLTLEHLQSLLDHGVGEGAPKSEARGMKHITTRWEKQWTWKPARQEWQRKVRFVCREFRWQEWRDDLFTPGSAPISNRLIDFVALKRGFEVMTLDATGAFYRAPEHEDVVVDPPQEYLDRLQAEGKSTDIYWKLKRQLLGRRTAAPGWVEHMAGILMDETRLARCEMAPQFFYNSETEVVVELHMDDLHVAGPGDALEGFRDEVGQHVTLSCGEIHEYGTTYEHLKRLRTRFEHGTELKANPKYLDYVVETLNLGSANAAPTPGVPAHKALMGGTSDLLYFKSLLEFMGFTVATTLLTDSSAARGIAKREGVGKVRGLEARVLWLQQAIKRKLMDLGTVGTDDNKADLGTKILGYERFVKFRTMNGIYTDMGQVAESDNQSDQVEFDVGAVAGVRRASGVAASPSVTRSAALAMITAAVALLQGCEGPAIEYDGYCDTEICSKDGVVASDWASYLLALVVWALVVATVFGYAGFRYAGWGGGGRAKAKGEDLQRSQFNMTGQELCS